MTGSWWLLHLKPTGQKSILLPMEYGSKNLKIVSMKFKVYKEIYRLFESILHAFLSEIISETLQKPLKTFAKLLDAKLIIFSNLSLLRQGKITVAHPEINLGTLQARSASVGKSAGGL